MVGEELQHRLQAPPGTVLAAAVTLLSGLGNKFPKAVAQLQPSYAPVEIHWRSWGHPLLCLTLLPSHGTTNPSRLL